MKKVISKKHKVVNKVSDYRFEELMKTGEYEEYKEKKDTVTSGTPKRKRRTPAEMQAAREVK